VAGATSELLDHRAGSTTTIFNFVVSDGRLACESRATVCALPLPV